MPRADDQFGIQGDVFEKDLIEVVTPSDVDKGAHGDALVVHGQDELGDAAVRLRGTRVVRTSSKPKCASDTYDDHTF